jgi:site-specific DNA-adenine methylase
LAGLASLGLVIDREIDVDGLKVRTWAITELGRTRLANAATVALPTERSGDDELPDITALAPWFGSARRIAAAVGEALRGCAWVGVPFCGGLSEIGEILAAGANAVGLNDAHRHLVNLARVAADSDQGAQLYRRLRRQPFAAEVLRDAQAYCAENEPDGFDDKGDFTAAFYYFICAWMSRSAEAGKAREFDAGLAIRYGGGGGNSVLRYWNAVGGLRAWRWILSRCSFSSDDAFEFLGRCNDRDDAGIYIDPPWPAPGAGYKHKFDEEQHRRLAARLLEFKKARVVVRTGGGALVEALYPRSLWRWGESAGRTQGNRVYTEWLLVRNGRREDAED